MHCAVYVKAGASLSLLGEQHEQPVTPPAQLEVDEPMFATADGESGIGQSVQVLRGGAVGRADRASDLSRCSWRDERHQNAAPGAPENTQKQFDIIPWRPGGRLIAASH